MSTVLLMTDTWHPTVLRLVPFSSNNAKLSERKSNGRQNNNRGFPILAVTRNGNKNNSASSNGARSARSTSTRSVRSARSDYCADNVSEVSAYTAPTRTDRSEDYVTKYRKYPQKKIPVTHSEMKEAIKFSVQDLNDQVSSCSSLYSAEDSDSKDRVQKADNTRTSLPKPSMCSPQEVKYITPINGVRRSVPLTPGEIELQKYRESCMLEQVQKRKKYKLNVNQLPRSTTPINDHDPDKLNMKQVIAFLQTKTPKDNATARRSSSERKCDSQRSYSQSSARRDSGVSTVSIRQKSSESHDPKVAGDARYVDRVDNTRDTNGCVSQLSTKSTPALPYGQSRGKEKQMGTMSVRSFGNRFKDSTKDFSRKKPVKEFKLYRFLAVAPEGHKRLGLTTAVTESIPNVDVTSLSYVSQQRQLSPDSPRKFLRKRARESTTANLIHRRVINKNGPLVQHAKGQPDVQIRLPSVGDSPDEDSETCSTTSATYNSTKNGSTENIKLPKKDKTITFLDEKKDTKGENKCGSGDENNNSETNKMIELPGFQTRTFKTPDFPKVSIHGPRHIHVNMPQENKGYSQEIVRLTLRQEKSTTRVTSYMSDIQSNLPSKWHELEKSELMENSKSEMTSPRHLVSTIANSNNSFIKVRQKLKTSNLSS